MAEHTKQSATKTLNRVKANLEHRIESLTERVKELELEISNTRVILGTVETVEIDELRKIST